MKLGRKWSKRNFVFRSRVSSFEWIVMFKNPILSSVCVMPKHNKQTALVFYFIVTKKQKGLTHAAVTKTNAGHLSITTKKPPTQACRVFGVVLGDCNNGKSDAERLYVLLLRLHISWLANKVVKLCEKLNGVVQMLLQPAWIRFKMQR